MKIRNIAIIAFFFLFQVGELLLPFSKSTFANNIVLISKKKKNILSANSYVKEGIKKGKYGNYEDAVKAFTQAILIDKFHSIAFYNRGLAKMNLDDYEGAISDYSKSIEINPEYAIAYLNRGVAKYNLDDYEGAISDYSKSIEINVIDADSYLNRGLIYLEIKNEKFACQDFMKAASLGNQFSASWLKSDNGKLCLGTTVDNK